jgi:hypothetical protein
MMAFRLMSGAPEMTVAAVQQRAWLTIIGCENGHSLTLNGAELVERFPPAATLGQLAERLKCSICGSTSGRIGFMQDNSPDAQVQRQRKDWGPIR